MRRLAKQGLVGVRGVRAGARVRARARARVRVRVSSWTPGVRVRAVLG